MSEKLNEEQLEQIEEGDIDDIEDVIDEDEVNFVNDEDKTALHLIAENRPDEFDIIDGLILMGADPELQDKNGNTPLHYLCQSDEITEEVLELFEAHLYDIENNDGETPGDLLKETNPELLELIAENAQQTKQEENVKQGEGSLERTKTTLPSDFTCQRIPYEDLVAGKDLGKGGFKRVFKGYWLGAPVAISELLAYKNFKESEKQEFLIELSNLTDFHHPNIVRFFGATHNQGNLQIVCEYCKNGDLFYYSRKNELTMLRRVQLALEVARGLHYLHNKDMAHLDLKSKNVLIDSSGVAKLIDFGLTKTLTTTRVTLHTTIGGSTLPYKAPELHTLRPLRSALKKSDIYAFGVLLWELETGNTPMYLNSSYMSGVTDVGEWKTPKVSGNETLLEVMKACWEVDHEKRPSIDVVLKKLNRVKKEIKKQK
ncbi:serine/threonine-protein kinase tnni3k-related [Anaeramoeba flamelloides]|uniref:Serine/threonine-protein kinase tnni3k-related n=1 Tax=Anaeramoeba flamelloides TaxID=1746091 RepID=A0AAV7YDA2_9EUKA|nr:serine/threonine-protein kinase tnni3k-related [Anaeramoeba flamelloides]KAJ6229995.1 serine/threonine-protein kinase tnni3k-related [Anaeramoeba flamelloides]